MQRTNTWPFSNSRTVFQLTTLLPRTYKRTFSNSRTVFQPTSILREDFVDQVGPIQADPQTFVNTLDLDQDILMYEPNVNSPIISNQLYTNIIPVGAHVKASVRAKILEGQFIEDLKIILPPK